jgi:mono/diheme cytochrome c family protein
MKFKRHTRLACAVLFVCAVLVAGSSQATADETPKSKPVDAATAERLFTETVGPLLKAKCVACHGGGDLQEGGLDLTSRAGALKGGMSDRKTLVPGKPAESLMYVFVTRRDPDLAMPPDDKDALSPSEIEAIRRWIAGGAPWAETKTPPVQAASLAGLDPWNTKSIGGVVVPTSGGLSDDWTNRTYQPSDIWAYLPLRHVTPPPVTADGKPAPHPIDAFLDAKLAERGLAPAPPADPRTWLRRATFDLTGLPPKAEDVDAFVRSGEKAYEAMVDQLLASPHYGEQMARHWLDVVRYADTSGFSNDYERPHAWRYRDYVVRSFNADKPYDRFVLEQLAGDELDPTDPEMLIAVGFLRMGPWEHTAMSVAAETRQAFLDDVTNSVGVTFLGQGLRCARCHDHKFDPVPTRDYYRIQACFAPTQFLDRDVAYLPSESTAGLDATKSLSEKRLADARAELAEFERKRREAQSAWAKEHGYASIDEVPPAKRPPQYDGLTDIEKSLRKIAQKREAYFQLEMRRYEPQALSVYDGPDVVFDMQRGRPQQAKPGAKRGANAPAPVMPPPAGVVATTAILRGGSLASPGDVVTPGVLSPCADSSDLHAASEWNTVPTTTEGRRLALARWIASERNPLTARVIVNRVWQMHFGRGLVATPNNFGKMGARPTHPELLDWLAERFIEHDWSIKQLHRLIMTSAAYRRNDHPFHAAQAAELDAKNELLAYFPTRRLSAEELRDAMAAASGELILRMGGPPVFPEIHWEVALQPRHIMGSVAPPYQPSAKPEDRHRRTLYAFRCRTLVDPMLEVFNAPGSETSCERRDQTTVTPQVFALFNGAATHDRALATAARVVESKATSDEARLDALFERVLGRKPSEQERRDCLAHLEQMRMHHRTHEPKPVSPPSHVRREMVEELTGKPFHWTEELDAMKHFVSDLKPWNVDAETRAWSELALVLINTNEFAYVR